jgi:hypothetical protein
MHRFEALLHRARIDLADLPPEVHINGALIYLGRFPQGSGRLLVHPRIHIGDNPEFVALVAHEIAHLLLSRYTAHPPNVLYYLLNGQREQYDRFEAEADSLAAHLLVPRALCAQCPGPRYPTPEILAYDLGVPPVVVRRNPTLRACPTPKQRKRKKEEGRRKAFLLPPSFFLRLSSFFLRPDRPVYRLH